MTDARLKEIEQRNAERTQGVWEAGRHMGDWNFPHVNFIRTATHDPGVSGDGIELRYGGAILCFKNPSNDILVDQSTADARFIAACSVDIPALLALVRAQQELLRECADLHKIKCCAHLGYECDPDCYDLRTRIEEAI